MQPIELRIAILVIEKTNMVAMLLQIGNKSLFISIYRSCC